MNDQVQSILKQLSITQRIGIIFAVLGSVAAIAILVMFASKPDYTPAFTNLAATDAGSIESALRGANIAYEVADAGATILVPVDDLGDAKIAAAAAGVTTGTNDTQGFDLFNNQQFGESEFDQQVTYQRAIEGQLTQTIQGMEGVASARVAVVMAQTGVLTSDDTPASASVVLTMTNGSAPSSGLVQAIVNTVAGSIAGLSADNVVVTDDDGHVLAGAADSADTAAAQAKDLVEQQAQAKIEALLDAALGPGHAAVAVSADVDTDKVEADITTYAPTGSNPPVSISNSYEQYGAGSSAGACGIPGSDSNVPGLSSYPGVCTGTSATTTAAPTAVPTAAASSSPAASPTTAAGATAAPTAAATSADAGTTSNNGYIQQQTTINYSVSQTVQHVVTEPGVVKRLSVAVLVDQSALGTLKTDTLQASISAAIGADPTRGDVVAVDSVTFAALPSSAAISAGSASAAAAPDVMKSVGDMSGTILGAVFALIMLLLFWINTRALGRRADETVMDLGPVQAGSNNYLSAPARSNAPAIAAPEAPPAEMPGATPQARIQERLRMVADERPDALVGLMHGWLREEDRRR
jgi:flagellar M-ring protein FliF